MSLATEPTTADAKQHHLALHEAFLATARARGAPAFVRALRARAAERFLEAGFPTTRDEDWKYTSVAPIAKVPFRLADAAALVVDAARVGPQRLEGAHEIVFVNGAYSPALSSKGAAEPGLLVGRLADAIAKDAGAVEPHLGRHASIDASPFAALNTAFLDDGAFVRIDKGALIERPIHVIFLSTAAGQPVACHPRLLCVAGEKAEAKIVETFAGIDGAATFTNAVAEYVLGPASVVKHTKVQRESEGAFHVSTTHLDLDRSVTYASQSISIGGSLVRNDVNAVCGGEGCEVTLDGLYLARGRQHVDNHTTIDHAKPNCASREVYKGVLDGRSRGVFNGKVYVRPDAQKTDGKQTNKNLLLSEHASIDTKPQLEIFANDVKCTHGATIGQIDEDALFYLRSRGIDRETARGLLIYAFATEITHKVPVEKLRSRLEEWVLRWLPERTAIGEAP